MMCYSTKYSIWGKKINVPFEKLLTLINITLKCLFLLRMSYIQMDVPQGLALLMHLIFLYIVKSPPNSVLFSAY